MKFFILLASVLWAATAKADCVNLSHKSKVGEMAIENRQLGCVKISRQMFGSDGDPLGEPSVVNLDGKWENESVDDDYESYRSQTRWIWNTNESILTYEFFVDSLDKASGDTSVSAGTKVYKKNESGKVSVESYSQLRILKKSGEVTVNQSHDSELNEPLL
jgi:hypothetical protein